MKLFGFKRKSKEYQSYQSSKHSEIYEQIAKGLDSNAQHVYEIAHGKSVNIYDDFVILDQLRKYKILK